MLNQRAPAFFLEASTGQKIHLQDLVGSFVVLVFYPLNNSPVCNKQLKDVNLNLEDFLHVNARVFGVNTAPLAKQKEYCLRKKLEFPILSDPEGKTAKQYKAHMLWLPFNLRTVVVINPQGIICFYKRGFPDSQEILTAITKSTLPPRDSHESHEKSIS